MTDRPEPLRAIAHPLWIGAFAVLVVNDHLLKGAGLLPGWLTGKLSDVAGMLVAPAVLSALLGLRSRAGFAAAHVAVGLAFAAIKLDAGAARALEQLTALGPLPWRITVDPTDLVSLPVLAVSFRVLGAAMRAPVALRPLAHRAALACGTLACAATSETDPCADGLSCGGWAEEVETSLVLGNVTTTDRIVRVRSLRDAVVVDCEAALADPSGTFSRELFGPATSTVLRPRAALALPNSGCDAYLVDADGLPMHLLFWRLNDYPAKLIALATSTSDPARTIVMRGSGSALSLGDHPAVHAAPPSEQPPVSADCRVPRAEVGIDWTEPPAGSQKLVSIVSSPDGCHALELLQTTVFVCVPPEAMPFSAGDVVTMRTWTSGATYPELEGETAWQEGLEIASDAHRLRLSRGNTLVRWQDSGAYDPSSDFSAKVERLADCEASHDACGSAMYPLKATLDGPTVPEPTTLVAGESAELSAGAGTFYLVRAQEMPVRDESCPPSSSGARYHESILVRDE